jgi:hypothetical protein
VHSHLTLMKRPLEAKAVDSYSDEHLYQPTWSRLMDEKLRKPSALCGTGGSPSSAKLIKNASVKPERGAEAIN